MGMLDMVRAFYSLLLGGPIAPLLNEHHTQYYQTTEPSNMPPIRNKNGSTHWITPTYAYAILLNYLRPVAKNWHRVLDPFPDKDQYCLQIAQRANAHFEDIKLQWTTVPNLPWDFSHIPDGCDAVLSNPPFADDPVRLAKPYQYFFVVLNRSVFEYRIKRLNESSAIH
jgi:hypothetical protein